MIIKMFSIFDSKMTTFSRPFFEQTEPSAIRVFRDAVNEQNPNNMWNKHPEDFSLFVLADFDDASGEIIPQLPKNLITASAIVELKKENPQMELALK